MTATSSPSQSRPCSPAGTGAGVPETVSDLVQRPKTAGQLWPLERAFRHVLGIVQPDAQDARGGRHGWHQNQVGDVEDVLR